MDFFPFLALTQEEQNLVLPLTKRNILTAGFHIPADKVHPDLSPFLRSTLLSPGDTLGKVVHVPADPERAHNLVIARELQFRAVLFDVARAANMALYEKSRADSLQRQLNELRTRHTALGLDLDFVAQKNEVLEQQLAWQPGPSLQTLL